jgi:hypothetical protein
VLSQEKSQELCTELQELAGVFEALGMEPPASPDPTSEGTVYVPVDPDAALIREHDRRRRHDRYTAAMSTTGRILLSLQDEPFINNAKIVKVLASPVARESEKGPPNPVNVLCLYVGGPRIQIHTRNGVRVFSLGDDRLLNEVTKRKGMVHSVRRALGQNLQADLDPDPEQCQRFADFCNEVAANIASNQPTGAGAQTMPSTKKRAGKGENVGGHDWETIKKEVEDWSKHPKNIYPGSIRKLATQFKCAANTMKKAFDKSFKLQGWRKRTVTPSAEVPTVAMQDVVLKTSSQSREPDPAKAVADAEDTRFNTIQDNPLLRRLWEDATAIQRKEYLETPTEKLEEIAQQVCHDPHGSEQPEYPLPPRKIRTKLNK